MCAHVNLTGAHESHHQWWTINDDRAFVKRVTGHLLPMMSQEFLKASPENAGPQHVAKPSSTRRGLHRILRLFAWKSGHRLSWILLDPAQDPATFAWKSGHRLGSGPSGSCTGSCALRMQIWTLVVLAPVGSCWILLRILLLLLGNLVIDLFRDLLDPAGSCAGSCSFCLEFLLILCAAPSLIIILFKRWYDRILFLTACGVTTFLEF